MAKKLPFGLAFLLLTSRRRPFLRNPCAESAENISAVGRGVAEGMLKVMTGRG